MKILQTDNVDLQEKIRDMDYRFELYDNQIEKYKAELGKKQGQLKQIMEAKANLKIDIELLMTNLKQC